MRELAQTSQSLYQDARPFPHIVLDDFFDPSLLTLVLEEFPQPGQISWKGFNNEYEVKLFCSADETFGPVTRLLMYHLNSITFLDFLSALTGIPDLIPDPTFNGGGMHQIERGGKLAIHADFNRHGRLHIDRRLNLLLYLNKDWRAEYGGDFELWDRDMTACVKKVAPLFNRMVVFSTTDFSYHGHPDELRYPRERSRKSLALYYYSNGRPDEERSDEHSTLFRARPAESFKGGIKRRIKPFVPPILFDLYDRITG